MNQQIGAQYHLDEISLLALIKIFWQQKWLICICIILCLTSSIIYLVSVKPTYEATITIAAPTEADISTLMVGALWGQTQEKDFNTTNIYRIFTNTLQSEAVKLRLFSSLNDLKTNATPEYDSYHTFAKNIIIKQIPQSDSNIFVISVRSGSASSAKQQIKSFLSLAENDASQKLDLLIKAKNLILLNELNLLKEVKEQNKKDQANNLRDNLAILDASKAKNVSLNLPESSNLIHLLESKYYFFNNIKLPNEKIRMFQLESIDTPETLIKPRVRLILILSIFAGCLLGCFIALIRNAQVKK